ncbi:MULTISPECIES: hypothetical protein [unclassified Variovorax]|uniref:hypothetical protein n=1 Tax=unclassified Variovorax TaxID=663243 RepID=UPI001317C780|nr:MULTISPECIES: hypothetical protein [unclassified Variovorax]VTU13575.1 hypothetical protein SRS16CHR_00659 [Variovorax sp. SRS16]VTU18575.1 hypothetical protein E5CHR_00615 [Variovorax sp. PBL-E5]
MDNLEALQTLGISLPSPAYIAGTLLFGIAGIVAWRYGKRVGRPRTRWLGLALMLYPYVVPQTWLLYLLGFALCAGIAIDRD